MRDNRIDEMDGFAKPCNWSADLISRRSVKSAMMDPLNGNIQLVEMGRKTAATKNLWIQLSLFVFESISGRDVTFI